MVEIDDRGIVYKSWKSYAKALVLEIKKLQQLLPTKDVNLCFNAVKRDIRKGILKGMIQDE